MGYTNRGSFDSYDGNVLLAAGISCEGDLLNAVNNGDTNVSSIETIELPETSKSFYEIEKMLQKNKNVPDTCLVEQAIVSVYGIGKITISSSQNPTNPKKLFDKVTNIFNVQSSELQPNRLAGMVLEEAFARVLNSATEQKNSYMELKKSVTDFAEAVKCNNVANAKETYKELQNKLATLKQTKEEPIKEIGFLRAIVYKVALIFCDNQNMKNSLARREFKLSVINFEKKIANHSSIQEIDNNIKIVNKM